VIIATVLSHTQGAALSAWYTVSAIVSGGLAGLFLLAFLTERAGSVAAYYGIGVSLLFTAYATLTLGGGKLWNLGRWNFPFHDYMIGVIGHVLLIAVGYSVSFLLPNRDPASKELTLWGWRRRNPKAAPVVRSAA
jgi:SSS family solute:Na+ symporter